jgi:uncharacterized protein
MSLIIDGYNLLHASGILARGIGPGVLERARTALLNFLAESLTAEEIARTTVVFDAQAAPRGLERTIHHRGILVRFASPEGEADAVIEELVRQDSAPRKLIVVSSDHRLHRAARRRKATPMDSDRWYSQIVQRRIAKSQPPPEDRPLTDQPLSDTETAYWLAAFADSAANSNDTIGNSKSASKKAQDKPLKKLPSPFPPGYADDIDETNVD